MELLLLSILTFFAALIGTITSFGTATIMVPILVNFYSYNPVLLFTGVIHWFGNLWKMYFFRKGLNLTLILLFGIPGIVAGYLSAYLVLNADKTMLSKLLGIFLIVYVGFLIVKPNWKVPKTPFSAVLGGILSGISSGIFGVGGAVRATFLTAFKLSKDTFIATAGAIGVFIDSSRLIGYVMGKTTLEGVLLWGLLVFIPVSFLGAYVGSKVVHTIPQDRFRLVVGIGLLFVTLKLIFFPPTR